MPKAEYSIIADDYIYKSQRRRKIQSQYKPEKIKKCKCLIDRGKNGNLFTHGRLLEPFSWGLKVLTVERMNISLNF